MSPILHQAFAAQHARQQSARVVGASSSQQTKRNNNTWKWLLETLSGYLLSIQASSSSSDATLFLEFSETSEQLGADYVQWCVLSLLEVEALAEKYQRTIYFFADL